MIGGCTIAKLLYIMPTSLDGYIADDGNFEWSAPDEEVLASGTVYLRYHRRA